MAKNGLINGYPHWLKTDESQAKLHLDVYGNLKFTYKKTFCYKNQRILVFNNVFAFSQKMISF